MAINSTSKPHSTSEMVDTQRGAFIVIEGLDRSGKSTQCERLCARLEHEGHEVKRMRFPGGPSTRKSRYK